MKKLLILSVSLICFAFTVSAQLKVDSIGSVKVQNCLDDAHARLAVGTADQSTHTGNYYDVWYRMGIHSYRKNTLYHNECKHYIFSWI